jgi:hypothetical protein
LQRPGRNYALWYLKTKLSAGQIRDRIKPALDRNNQLAVIDATNNQPAGASIGAVLRPGLSEGNLRVT